MKISKASMTVAALALGLFTVSQPAVAGAVKGAAKGAVVGHLMGHHAKAGAAIGAIHGHHKAKMAKKH